MRGIVTTAGLLLSLQTLIAQETAFQQYEQTIPGSQVKFSMAPIQAGEFLMGSPASENSRKPNEGPQKKVKLDAFWMGSREVTYDEFLLFFYDENTSRDS